MCPEEMQKRARGRDEWLWQEGIQTWWVHEVATRSTSITFGSFSRGVHNTIHVPPLPLIPTTSSLLHLLWAHLGYITQLSGRLSVLWLARNLGISLFLAYLHSHLSLPSLNPSAVTLRLWNLCTRSIEGLEYIRCALEPYGESVPRSTPPALPPQLC
jgi:hypothetical protein